MPTLPKVVEPQEIVPRAKGEIICHLNEDKACSDSDDNVNNDGADEIQANYATSQLGLAYQAIT